MYMKGPLRLLLIVMSVLAFTNCPAQDYSGYTLLSEAKKKHFIPFNIDSINSKVSYSENNFTVQELQPSDVQTLTQASKYTWVVIWAPWCTGTKEIAQEYLKYEEALSSKGIRLVLVAVGYGPDGISKVLTELNYEKPTYVIAKIPDTDNVKAFRKALNSKFKYRHANHYIFEQGKGLIYTASIDRLPLQTLESLIQ